MAYIVNEIPVLSRTDVIARKLTCMLNKDIKKRCKNSKAEPIQRQIENAAKVKQGFEAETKKTEDAIKESEAAKAYYGLK